MGRRNQEFPGLLLALETVLEREMGDETGSVQISNEMCIVIGHNPLERPLTLYVAGQIFVVPVVIGIQIEAIAVRVVGWVKICKYALAFTSTGEMLDEESKRIHVGDVNLLTVTREREDAFRKTFSAETSINTPFPCLRIAPDRSSSKKDAGPITAIQVESGETKFKIIAVISAQIDKLLPSPFRNAQRNRQDGISEPLWLTKYSMPEGSDTRVKVVQVEFRDGTFPKKAQRSSCTTGKRFEV